MLKSAPSSTPPYVFYRSTYEARTKNNPLRKLAADAMIASKEMRIIEDGGAI